MNNKRARELLEETYGEKCMIHDGIFSFMKPKTSSKKYTLLTYHHIKPKREGGEPTVENGAILCDHCHKKLEALPETERERINKMLKAHKHRLGYNMAIMDFAKLDKSNAVVIQAENTKRKDKCR